MPTQLQLLRLSFSSSKVPPSILPLNLHIDPSLSNMILFFHPFLISSFHLTPTHLWILSEIISSKMPCIMASPPGSLATCPHYLLLYHQTSMYQHCVMTCLTSVFSARLQAQSGQESCLCSLTLYPQSLSKSPVSTGYNNRCW